MKKRHAVSSILGVDPNSGCEKDSGIGYARWLKHSGHQKWWTLDTYGLIEPPHYSVNIERRLPEMARELWKLTEKGSAASADRMVVERPWGIAGRLAANNALWRTVGLCEAIAALRGMEFSLVLHSTWRKSTCGNAKTRREAKRRAINYVDKVFGLRVGIGSDVAEAILIGFWSTQVECGIAGMRKGRRRRA